MTGSSTTTPPTGSAPILSGTPAVIGFAQAVVDRYEKFISQALDEIAAEEREYMRKQAESNEDWSQYADLIDVQYDHADRELKYSVNATGETLSKVQELEFGSPNASPRPLLRTRAAAQKEEFNSRVTARVNKLMGNAY